MPNNFSYKKPPLLLVPIAIGISSLLLTLPGCSPKIKVGLWAKNNKVAAEALEGWVTDRPDEATLLLVLDCADRKAFKKKITDALNNAPAEQPAQQGYDVRQHNYHYGNMPSRGSGDGFADWCRKYPKAAKRLRGHAKALCKTGIGILKGSIK